MTRQRLKNSDNMSTSLHKVHFEPFENVKSIDMEHWLNIQISGGHLTTGAT